MKPEMEIVGRDKDHIEGSIDEPIDKPIDKPIEEFSYRGRNTEFQETKLEGAGTVARESVEAREPVPEMEDAPTEAQEGLFGRTKAILLLKALTVLVVMLLAIEAILYFI